MAALIYPSKYTHCGSAVFKFFLMHIRAYWQRIIFVMVMQCTVHYANDRDKINLRNNQSAHELTYNLISRNNGMELDSLSKIDNNKHRMFFLVVCVSFLALHVTNFTVQSKVPGTWWCYSPPVLFSFAHRLSSVKLGSCLVVSTIYITLSFF